MPGTRWERGRTHPLTLVIDEIIDIFWGMGFEIARGPDIEDDYHNFEALNIPEGSSCARHAGYLLCGAGPVAANSYLSSANPYDGEPQTAAAGHRAGRGVSARRRRDPLADVPPGRRVYGRPGDRVFRSQRRADAFFAANIRPGDRRQISPELFSRLPNRAPRSTFSA